MTSCAQENGSTAFKGPGVRPQWWPPTNPRWRMNIQTRTDPVARARELGPEISAAADEIERTRRVPAALLERMTDFRLFRMVLPRSAGGDEVDPAVYVAALEEIARHDASIG